MDRKMAIISDVHGNLEALSEVLRSIEEEKVDKIYSLGDVIGYGTDPNSCVEELAKKHVTTLYGNHERIMLGYIVSDGELCKISEEWTSRALSDDTINIIKGYQSVVREGNVVYSHSKPNDESFPYLNNKEAIAGAFPKKGIYFYGHTHRPRFTRCDSNGNIMDDYLIDEEQSVTFTMDEHVMINVGSVGQARSSRTIANYVICEHKDNQITVNFCFLPYEYYTVYRKVRVSMGEEMADYLIREEWRRKEFKEKMVEECIF